MTTLELETPQMVSEVQSFGFTEEPFVATLTVSGTQHARRALQSERSLDRTEPTERRVANRETTFAGSQLDPNLDRDATRCSAHSPEAVLLPAGGERDADLMWKLGRDTCRRDRARAHFG